MKILYIGSNDDVKLTFTQALQSNQLCASVHCDFLLDGKLKNLPRDHMYDLVFIDEAYAMFKQLRDLRCVNPSCYLAFLSKNPDLSIQTLIQDPVTVLNIDDSQQQTNLIFKQMDMPIAITIRNQIIYQNDIIYACVAGHDLTLYCWHEKNYTVHKSLKGLVKEINNPDFIQIEKAVAINVKYMKSIKSNDILMTDGTILQVGKTFKQHLKKRMKLHPSIKVN